ACEGCFQTNFDPRGEIAPAVDSVPPTTLAGSFGDSLIHKVCDESQRIEEVTLPRGVAADEERERFQSHVAKRDALVAADSHPPQECGSGSLVRRAGRVYLMCG